MLPLLPGKIVYVSGGSQGLGAAIARAAVREGAEAVAVTGRRREPGEELVADLAEQGATARFAAVRQAVASGELGWVHTVRSTTLDPAPPPAAYLAVSGGIFRDCAVHDVDAVRWVTGREVGELHATGSDRDDPVFADVDDVASLRTRVYPNQGRIEAAAAAGFTGFGLLSADLPAAEEKYGLDGIRAMLDDNGIVEIELEGVPCWWDAARQDDAARRDVFRAAEALGARHVDAWHVERAGTPVADLAAVPLHRIVGVELNDADAEVIGTLFDDTVHRRRYCGEGEILSVEHR